MALCESCQAAGVVAGEVQREQRLQYAAAVWYKLELHIPAMDCGFRVLPGDDDFL